MSVDVLLSKLERARKTGADSWLACCPHHGDKHPSMTMRELEDGRVLLHCFTGCSVEEILGSVGLEFDALFPEKRLTDERLKPLRRPFNAHDVLKAVCLELDIVALAALELARNKALSEPELMRLSVAQTRIHEARGLSLGE